MLGLNNLQAIESPQGHGDSFWGVALALPEREGSGSIYAHGVTSCKPGKAHIMMHTELVPARVEDKSVITNLLQLYLYDFSELAGWAINEHGLFNYPYLDHYWTEPDRHPFLVRADGELAGLALVCSLASDGEHVNHLAEFFILRKLRRIGVGEAAARQLFDRFPGTWSVAQRNWNVAAQHFWRRVIDRYTGGAFTERHDDDKGRIIQEFTVAGDIGNG